MKREKVRKWTSDEVGYLKKFSYLGIEKLMDRFPDRTETAIKVKCCYLGLRLSKDVKEVTERLYMVV